MKSKLIIILLISAKVIFSYENLISPQKDLVSINNLTTINSESIVLIPRELNWDTNNDSNDQMFKILDTINITSYNSEFFHGSLDSGWWQGKGFNNYLSSGIAFQIPFLKVILAPEFYFSENLSFETFNTDYTNPNSVIDNPERMGDDTITDFNWGQSSISLNYNGFSIGFGFENIWIGPSKYNPTLISNNAEGIPKLDLRMEPIKTLIGTFESYMFYGQLDDSNIDNGSDYDKTFINGLTVGYSPSLWPNLNIGVSRMVSSKWEDLDISSLYTMFDFEAAGGDDDFGTDTKDQRISISFDIRYPEQGFRIYTDLGRNDFSPNIRYILRYPMHTVVYTAGVEQRILNKKDLSLYIECEVSDFILSEDYEIDLGRGDAASFYAHGKLINGFTNNGQILGAGISSGSDSQLFGISMIYKDMYFRLYYQRVGNNFDYLLNHDESPDGIKKSNILSSFGLKALVPYNDFLFEFKFEPVWELNNNYIANNDEFNIYLSLAVTYQF